MARVSLTKAQKKKLCIHADTLPKSKASKYKTLALWAQEQFHLDKPPGKSTISDILKLRDQLLRTPDSELSGKRSRRPDHPQLEEVLATFVHDMAAARNPVNRKSLEVEARSQAKKMQIHLSPDFKFSVGWMTNFMRRHKFRSRPVHGHANTIAIVHDHQ